jgi:uncharacterized protein YjbJ (UPF0337 family)
MKLNENTTKGKWREIRGEIQKAWGKLTDDELDQTKGDIKVISGLLQQRYGDAQSAYNDKLSVIFSKFEMQKDAAIKSVENNLR